jgi:ADP-heptose:LPS heptosyltransferase
MQTLLKALDRTLGAVVARVLGWCSRRPTTTKSDILERPLSRILVIRPGGIGDMLLLLPVLRLLRKHAPDAQLDVICEKRNTAALDLAGVDARALLYDRHPLGLLVTLLRQRYDLVIDTEQFHHFSAVFAWLSGAPHRIGFRINPRRNPLYTHLVNYAVDGPEGEQFLALLAPLGILGTYRLAGSLKDLRPCLTPAVTETIEGLRAGAPLAILHPVASAAYKEWQGTAFEAVAQALTKTHNLTVVVVGSPSDRRRCDSLAANARQQGADALSVAGKLSLHETATLLQEARLFIGTDSGLAHLAIALGTPTVVLFGPSDPDKWGVRSVHHTIVHRALPCSPCCMFGKHTPCTRLACMQAITVDEVMEAAGRVLSAARDPAETPVR